jgi:hypothetical protein
MKICVIGTRGIPNIQGGVEKHCQGLYPRLAKKGLNINIRKKKLLFKVPTLRMARGQYPVPCFT